MILIRILKEKFGRLKTPEYYLKDVDDGFVKIIYHDLREKECVICFGSLDNNRIAIIPCGHANVCPNCLDGLDKCPNCFGLIAKKQKIYL